MLLHYLSLAWQQLEKYRLQSAVSIVSLAIGFACFALASMWIKYETTYDAFHKDADRMYFLTEDRSMLGNQSEVENRINKAFCDTLFKHCPEIVPMAHIGHIATFGYIIAQFPGHSHHSLHALLVRSDVSLNGLMLFRGGLNSRKVKSKVVLRDKGTERTNTKFKSHQWATKKQKMEVES